MLRRQLHNCDSSNFLGGAMPDKEVIKRARRDARQGKSPSTQASEFVHDEIKKIRAGKHGARSAKQAIAIGLSEARRAGVKLPPAPGSQKAPRRAPSKPSTKRSKAILKALKREPKSSVSHEALSQQAKQSAAQRGSTRRHQAAVKAVRTKGPRKLRQATKKASHARE